MPLETFSEQYNPGQYLEISVSTRLATFVRYRRSDLNLQLIVDGGIYAFEDPHRTDRDYNIWGIGLGPRLEYEYTLGFSESTVYRYGADFAILKAISIGIYGDVKAGGYRPDDLGWINGWNYGVGIFARFGALSINLGNRIFMLDDNIDFSTYGVSIGIGL